MPVQKSGGQSQSYVPISKVKYTPDEDPWGGVVPKRVVSSKKQKEEELDDLDDLMGFGDDN